MRQQARHFVQWAEHQHGCNILSQTLSRAGRNMDLDPRLWLLSKFCKPDEADLQFPLDAGRTAELRDAFAYVGLTFVEPAHADELKARYAALTAEVEAQNRYLFKLSGTGFRDDPREFVGSKFVADVVQSGRRAFAARH
jgi:hypothetical protein